MADEYVIEALYPAGWCALHRMSTDSGYAVYGTREEMMAALPEVRERARFKNAKLRLCEYEITYTLIKAEEI